MAGRPGYSNYAEIRGLDELRRGLNNLEQTQFNYVIVQSVNELLEGAKPIAQAQMLIDFDNPTPFTVNSLRIDYANKRAEKYTGRIWFKDPDKLSPSQHYLYPPTRGGARGFKDFEGLLWQKRILPAGYMCVPGKRVQLDGYGNVSRGLIREIVAYFEAFPVRDGVDRNSTDASRARRRRGTRNRFGYSFFVLKRPQNGLPAGIYSKTYTRERGGDSDLITLIFLFVPRTSAWYAKQYKIDKAVNDYAEANIQPVFRRWMQEAIRTAFRS